LAGPIVRSSNLQFFLDRAEQARAEAEAATLGLVRERCRRSEAACSSLAEKAQRGERLRLKNGRRRQPRQSQMKITFKKNYPQATSAPPSADRRHSEPSGRAFNQVAYAAALEVLG
jgi:hypothetical protein